MSNRSHPMSEEISDSEMWKLYKQRSQEKREQNRHASAEILKDSGVEFSSKNFGAHLIVTHNGVTVDFWPGTGKWIIRNGKSGRGVKSLINTLKAIP